MGYLFLAIALFTGAGKGFCGKKVSGRIQGFKDSMLTNSLRMVFCILIGFVMVFAQGGFKDFCIDPATLAICALSGISTAAFVILWLVSVKNGSYMVMDVFLTLGVIFTTVLCKIFFNESIRTNQYIGFVLLVISAAIMCSYSNSSIGKITFKSVMILILTGVANGLCGFSQKLFVHNNSGVSNAAFNFYTYVFSAITIAVCFMLIKEKQHEKGHSKKLIKSTIGYIGIMAIFLFANSYFMTLAATLLDSALMYPLNQGAALILATLMAVVFFKEKLNAKCILGMGLTFVSLLVINLL